MLKGVQRTAGFDKSDNMSWSQDSKWNTTPHSITPNNIELGAVIDVIHAPQIQHVTVHTCTKPPIATSTHTQVKTKAGPAT